MATSAPRSAKLLRPKAPTVKAIAPKAPTGAARIRIATSRNTTSDSFSSKASTGSAGLPTSDKAIPNNMAMNRVWRIEPSVSADIMVVGMMSSRKAVISVCRARSA